METLLQRLVANPHDQEALAYAHRCGTVDPRAYAILLEKVGQATADPAYAAHWLSEAANVWSTTIGDAHHAARTLIIAIEKDPTVRTASERLTQLYRDKGDLKALVALLERLVNSLTPLVKERPDVRPYLVSIHEELGQLWSNQPFSRPERAVENWRRVAEFDPRNQYAIFAAREMLKAAQQWADAVQYFAMEQAIVGDPERKIALYCDEADVRRRARDRPGATQALRHARALRPDDIALKQEVGISILDRLDAGEDLPLFERDEAARIFVSLAEAHDGAYGMSCCVSALKAQPGNDRAMQLADYYAGQLDRAGEIAPQYAAYLGANPNGFMGETVRAKIGAARQPPTPTPVQGRQRSQALQATGSALAAPPMPISSAQAASRSLPPAPVPVQASAPRTGKVFWGEAAALRELVELTASVSSGAVRAVEDKGTGSGLPRRLGEPRVETGDADREPVHVFVSHAPADAGLREELEKHISLLTRHLVIRTWHEALVVGGDDWRAVAGERLDAAQVIIFLVSADYLASERCYELETRSLAGWRSADHPRPRPRLRVGASAVCKPRRVPQELYGRDELVKPQ